MRSVQGEGWSPEVMTHHITDQRVIEVAPFGEIVLPQFPPVHLGPLVLDLSPTKHVVFLLLAAVFTFLSMAYVARVTVKRARSGAAPSGFANLIEAFVVYLRDEVALRNIGHGGERFVPYVLTLFSFILYANLLGLVPWGATATSNIAVTGALAALSLVLVEVSGFLSLGPRGYLRTIVFVPEGLPWYGQIVMAAVMTPVEILGKLAKPFALAIRLFANMTAGHFVILSLVGLILTYGALVQAPGAQWKLVGGLAIVGSLGLALFVMVLEIFVALLQAYIFAMLTSVFVGLIRHGH
ncbi:MAG: F0F1 ATP synthase subunit A [Gemmatimonadetes bacterium]|nr:F0F1 ATP synthase subunit A [Gemmatimonadota bacterium]